MRATPTLASDVGELHLADAGARAHRHPPLLRWRVGDARGAGPGDGARLRPRRRRCCASARRLRPRPGAVRHEHRRHARPRPRSASSCRASPISSRACGSSCRHEAGRRRPGGDLRPRGRDGLPLAAPPRRGAARPARRARGLRADRQDDGHPVPAPVGEPARRVVLRRARQDRRPARQAGPRRRRNRPADARHAAARVDRARRGVAELDGASDAFPFAHTVRLEATLERRAADHDHDRGPRRARAGQLRLPPVPADPGRPARRVARRAPGDPPLRAVRPADPDRGDRAGRALHRPARRSRLRRRLRRAADAPVRVEGGDRRSRSTSRRASPSPRSSRRPRTT